LTSPHHEAIWKLTQQNGEPPDKPVTITNSYELVGEFPAHGSCAVRVRTKIFGFVVERDDGLAFRKSKNSTQVWNVPVICTESVCKVDISFAVFKIPPHPNRDAAGVWLSDLERMQKTPQDTNRMHQLLETVQSLH